MLNIFYEHIIEGAMQEDITIEEMLKKAVSFGYGGLECDLWRLSAAAPAKALFDSAGVRVSSVYSTFDFGHESEDVSLRKIHHHLETAAFFGADKVLAVPGFLREGDNSDVICGKICGMLGVMCKQAEAYGITVTVEDYDDKNAPYSTISGLEYFLKNAEGLKLSFDTGNFAYSCENAADAYDRLKEHIAHVHLKDRSYDISRADEKNSNGKADICGKVMYPCEVGEGFIGIEGLIGRLCADGYKGSFSVEHFGAVRQLEYMKKSAENVRKILL